MSSLSSSAQYHEQVLLWTPLTSKSMPRRGELKCVVDGVLGSFVSRNNDCAGYWAMGLLYGRALEASSNEISFTLIGVGDDVHDLALDTALRTKYREMLVKLMSGRSLPASWIKSAIITVHFEYAGKVGRVLARLERPYLAQLSVTTDLGKNLIVERIGACWPHEPGREYRSSRAY